MNFEVCFLAGWWEFSYWEGLEVGDSMAAHCDRTAKQHRVHMTISITDMCNMWKIVKNCQTTQIHVGINHRHTNIHNDFDVDIQALLWDWHNVFLCVDWHEFGLLIVGFAWLAKKNVSFIGKCTIAPTRGAQDLTWHEKIRNDLKSCVTLPVSLHFSEIWRTHTWPHEAYTKFQWHFLQKHCWWFENV